MRCHVLPEKGIPLLSARNIKEGFIDLEEDFSYITEKNFEEISKNNPIQINNILLTIVGTQRRTRRKTPRTHQSRKSQTGNNRNQEKD
ncbi:hypothetical protein LC607_20985 [Nostoc sp. CHAB 5824]|nr:hypothetical protein [Nostoc sp. CHAB 5824]